MKQWRKAVAVLAMVGGLMMSAGCMGLGGGVAASTTPLEGKEYIVLNQVESTDSCVMLLGFIPVSDFNSVRDCVDDALKKHACDGLINVTVDTYTAYFILFSRTYTRVKGTAIRFTGEKKKSGLFN